VIELPDVVATSPHEKMIPEHTVNKAAVNESQSLGLKRNPTHENDYGTHSTKGKESKMMPSNAYPTKLQSSSAIT